MARTLERTDAQLLYTQEMKDIKEISGILNVPEKTLYRWREEDEWDKNREAFRRTPQAKAQEVIVSVADKLSKLADQMQADGKLDSQGLFALNKLLEQADRMNRSQHMYPYILQMTKELTDFLEEDHPELLEQLLPALKKFGERMAKKYRRT